MTPYISIYIHIPFCTHRCAYCDFNTYARQEALIPAYVEALCEEIKFVGRQRSKLPDARAAVHTLFLGGGTPSLLSSRQFEEIFRVIRANFDLLDVSENTIEANPGTVSFEELRRLRAIGINRISFGLQSASTEELRMLERTHDFFDVIEAVASARRAGFDNLNLDLIYGLPEQSLRTWQTSLQRVLELHPEHISAYALTLEHGTPFGRWAARGLLPLPDPDLAAEMYEWAGDALAAAGYVQYEISNWALQEKGENLSGSQDPQPSHSVCNPTLACRHNIQYWRSLPYLAFGAGAHGYANGYRYSNVLRIKTYIERMAGDLHSPSMEFPLSPATVNRHRQTERDEMSEFMMTGLRMTKTGISNAEFRARFGNGLLDIYQKEIGELIQHGLLEWIDASVRLTKRGRLLGNQVFLRFVE